MALTYATIAGSFFLPDGVTPRPMSVSITGDTMDGTLKSSAESAVLSGTYTASATTGPLTISLPLLSGLEPDQARWRATFTPYTSEAEPSPVPSSVVFALSGDTTWAALIDVSGVPVTDSLITQFQTLRDETVAARDQAVAVGNTNDTIIAGRVNDPASATRSALNTNYATKAEVPNTAQLVRKGELVINAADYGASPTATASANVTALNNAAAAAIAAYAEARLFIPPGNYPTNGTVSIACALDASTATLTYTGAGTALVIGANTTGSLTNRRTFHLPRVVKAARGWDGTSIGVRMVNLNTCQVHIPFVQHFERGLVAYGFGGGFAYNTIHLGALWQNHKNLILDADSGGFCNQNTWLGGRLQQFLEAGVTDEDTTANQMLLGETTGAAPNTNTFLGTSVEGDNPSFYRLDVHGRYNKWINCRWENFTTASHVRWNADALYNQIEHGYGADTLVETLVAGSTGNEIRDRFGAYISATNTTAQTIPDNVFTSVSGWSNNSRRAPYTNGNSSWVPRQGRWRISAAVTFSANATGVRRAGLYVDGIAVRVGDSHADGTRTTQVRVTGNYKFDGTEALTVRAFQTSGAGLPLSVTVGFVHVDAEWVGP